MAEFDRNAQIEIMKKSEDYSSFSDLLREYIFKRLGLPGDTHEDNLYYLVLYSVRIKMPEEDVKTLESRLATVDCHQTSFIVSKKTLLMMEIESGLSVHISPEKAEYSDTVTKYSEVLWRSLRNVR